MPLKRSSDVGLNILSSEKHGRFRRGLSIETARTISKDDFLDSLDEKMLTEKIRLFEKESEQIRKENLLFSRYLHRVHRSNVIQTFEDCQEQENLGDLERTGTNSSGNFLQTFHQMARRRSSNRSGTSSTLWGQLAANRDEILQIPLFSEIEREKISIAVYELEQMHLDWNRMKTNASIEFERLDVNFRSFEADRLSEELLNADLERTIEKLQVLNDPKRSVTRRVMLPADLIIKRIRKFVNDKTTNIGLLRLDRTRILARFNYIDVTIGILERQREKMDEADIRFVRARHVDFTERLENIQRELIFAKASQHPLLIRCQKLKFELNEEEKMTKICKKKQNILEHFLKQLNDEIQSIEQEIEHFSNENRFLTEQMSDVKSVPSISDYARVIRRLQDLHSEIDIWTKRVKIIENFHLSLKSQCQSRRLILPSISIMNTTH